MIGGGGLHWAPMFPRCNSLVCTMLMALIVVLVWAEMLVPWLALSEDSGSWLMTLRDVGPCVYRMFGEGGVSVVSVIPSDGVAGFHVSDCDWLDWFGILWSLLYSYPGETGLW